MVNLYTNGFLDSVDALKEATLPDDVRREIYAMFEDMANLRDSFVRIRRRFFRENNIILPDEGDIMVPGPSMERAHENEPIPYLDEVYLDESDPESGSQIIPSVMEELHFNSVVLSEFLDLFLVQLFANHLQAISVLVSLYRLVSVIEKFQLQFFNEKSIKLFSFFEKIKLKFFNNFQRMISFMNSKGFFLNPMSREDLLKPLSREDLLKPSMKIKNHHGVDHR
jgi:hypothetical protein